MFSAVVVAENYVKDKLKSPSTAKFAGYGEYSVKKLNNNTWEVNSYVDSHNSFGAMLRTHFTVKLRYTENQNRGFWENWSLVSLDFR